MMLTLQGPGSQDGIHSLLLAPMALVQYMERHGRHGKVSQIKMQSTLQLPKISNAKWRIAQYEPHFFLLANAGLQKCAQTKREFISSFIPSFQQPKFTLQKWSRWPLVPRNQYIGCGWLEPTPCRESSFSSLIQALLLYFTLVCPQVSVAPPEESYVDTRISRSQKYGQGS